MLVALVKSTHHWAQPAGLELVNLGVGKGFTTTFCAIESMQLFAEVLIKVTLCFPGVLNKCCA